MRTHLEGSQFLLPSDKQEDDEAAAGTHNSRVGTLCPTFSAHTHKHTKLSRHSSLLPNPTFPFFPLLFPFCNLRVFAQHAQLRLIFKKPSKYNLSYTSGSKYIAEYCKEKQRCDLALQTP